MPMADFSGADGGVCACGQGRSPKLKSGLKKNYGSLPGDVAEVYPKKA